MAARIKLKRLGKIRTPQYRIIVADARTKRDGRAIEELGLYHPKEEPSLIRVDSERVQYWLGVGAQPTDSVLAILKITGDWQKHKGLPGAEGTLRTKPERESREDRFAAAVAAAHSTNAAAGAATTPRRPRTATPAEQAADTSENTQGEAADRDPAQSARIEAVAEDPTAGGDELPAGAADLDAAPSAGTPHAD